ncbi:peptidase domain-containing ABC transporter [Emticicia sp. 21SJ11W-3]|uniref:peptidase domain-containing ABC transporter n=1 Tax=Emticicia sp. 21SJ11W-3 TaxID=2916755 RepID=UPI0020A174F5|nr:ATP-binding cassette domain-containing protein [Emticicia sp. 21SJ11W-3]UTA66761.1 ATP-binding cassette domain-containing protein [Emticicia sp. 21SJ11W-3]
MADNHTIHPFIRIFNLLRLDQKDITSLYFFAILSGIIQLVMPLGIQSIINFVMYNTASTSLVVLIGLVIVSVFLAGLLQINQMKLSEKIQQKIFVRYAFEYADTLPKIRPEATEGYYMPEQTNRFFDTINLQKGLSKLLLGVPTAIVQILFGILLLSFYHAIFIAFGGLLILIVYLIFRLSSDRGLETSLKESDYKYKVAAWLQEISRNQNTFKNYEYTHLNIQRTDEFTQGYLQNRTRHFGILKTQYWSLVAFKVILTAAMLIIGCALLLNQLINIGQFIAAEIVIIAITASVEKLITSIDIVYDVLTAVEKLNKVLQKPTESSGKLKLNNANPLKVEFKNVSFAYTRHSTILNGLSFVIQPGEKALLMKTLSGRGTSTVMKLISNNLTQYQGHIYINDVPIDNYDILSIRKHLTYLSGQNEIFNGSLWDNISIGNTDIKPETVTALIKILGFDGFIDEFDNGYDTELFTKGAKLSSHLIQEILLLRTFVQPSSLMVLDEPFKNLSATKAQKVAEYICNLPITVVVASEQQEIKPHFNKILELK